MSTEFSKKSKDKIWPQSIKLFIDLQWKWSLSKESFGGSSSNFCLISICIDVSNFYTEVTIHTFIILWLRPWVLIDKSRNVYSRCRYFFCVSLRQLTKPRWNRLLPMTDTIVKMYFSISTWSHSCSKSSGVKMKALLLLILPSLILAQRWTINATNGYCIFNKANRREQIMQMKHFCPTCASDYDAIKHSVKV